MRQLLILVTRNKIDAMRNEIQDLQRTLNAMNTSHDLAPTPASGQARNPFGPPSVAQQTAQSPSALTGQFSPAAWPPRDRTGESHRMAMTRENSPEPAQGAGGGTASVLVTEPMGGLYEVTRLRNIRSNQAKLDRSGPESDDQMDDFIARGVSGADLAHGLYTYGVFVGDQRGGSRRSLPDVCVSLLLLA